jgi:hypothetical protein
MAFSAKHLSSDFRLEGNLISSTAMITDYFKLLWHIAFTNSLFGTTLRTVLWRMQILPVKNFLLFL